MLIKKGRFYYYYLDNVEVDYDIIDWETPFGLEKFGKKNIVNLKIPKNNNGKNIEIILKQISDEIMNDFNEFAKLPIKYNLLRCEYIGDDIFEKNDKISGKLNFKIYNFKGNFGVSVILKKNEN